MPPNFLNLLLIYRETKDDLALDSSFSDQPCGRRRSRSADSITKEDANTDKNEMFRKLAAEHKKKSTDDCTDQTDKKTPELVQAHNTLPAENSFQQKFIDPKPHGSNSNTRAKGSGLQPAVGRNSKSSSDASKTANNLNGKASPDTSRKPIGRKSTPSAKDSCRDSGPLNNRYNRRHDDDHDDRGGPGSKPGWNYGGGGASGSYSRPWRQNSQTGSSGQGGNNRNGNNRNNGKLILFFVYFNDQIYNILCINRETTSNGWYLQGIRSEPLSQQPHRLSCSLSVQQLSSDALRSQLEL